MGLLVALRNRQDGSPPPPPPTPGDNASSTITLPVGPSSTSPTAKSTPIPEHKVTGPNTTTIVVCPLDPSPFVISLTISTGGCSLNNRRTCNRIFVVYSSAHPKQAQESEICANKVSEEIVGEMGPRANALSSARHERASRAPQTWWIEQVYHTSTFIV